MSQEIPKIRLAECCATCKWSSFRRAESYFGSGTKMTGLCTHPEVINVLPEEPIRVGNLAWWSRFYDLPSIYKKGIDYNRHTKVPTLKEYIIDERDYNRRPIKYWEPNVPYEQRYSYTNEERYPVTDEELELWYNRCKEYDTWWRENGDKVRFIHRVTVCDSYETGGRRAQVAIGMVKRANKEKA